MRTPLRAFALSAALVCVPGSLSSPPRTDHRTLHHTIDSALFEGDLTRAGVLVANAWGSLPRQQPLALQGTLWNQPGTSREDWLDCVLVLMSQAAENEGLEPARRRRAQAASDRLRSEIFAQVESENVPLEYLRETCERLELFGPPTLAWIDAYRSHFADWNLGDRDNVLSWMQTLGLGKESERVLAAWEVTHPAPAPEPETTRDWEALRLEVLDTDDAVTGDIDEVIQLCNRLSDAGRTADLREMIERIFEADYGDFLLIWNAYPDDQEQILPEVRRYVESHLPELLPDVLIELLDFTEGSPDPIEFGPDHPAHLEVRRLLIASLRTEPEAFADTEATIVLETLLPSVVVHGWPDGIDDALEALTLHLAVLEEDPVDRASVLHTAGSVCFDHGRRDLALGLLERAANAVATSVDQDPDEIAWYRRSLELARLGISPDYAP